MLTIRFREIRKPYGFCSNFAYYSFYLKGKDWKTVEHYFQAQKFAGTEYEEEIRLLDYPRQAKWSGNDRDKPLRPDWEEVKVAIMKEAVKAKFDQNPEIKEALLDSNKAYLLEDAPWDDFWGSGKNGMGKNMLGLILMDLRDQYRNNA